MVGGLVLALSAATAAFGAVLGYALPAWSGLETITVLERSIPATPITFALYGGVSVALVLAVLLLVVTVLSRFDDEAV